MTTKKEKLNAQQAFNLFLFETMMDRIRGAELLGQDIQKLQGQIDAMKSVYPAHRINHGAIHDTIERQNKQICSLFSRIEKCEELLKLEGRAQQDQNRRLTDHDESIEALSETVDQLSTCKCEAGAGMLKRIAELEEIVEQLQISRSAEMLYENEANKRLEGLENRLSRAQDMIAEMHKEGFIPVKQPQRKSPVK